MAGDEILLGKPRARSPAGGLGCLPGIRGTEPSSVHMWHHRQQLVIESRGHELGSRELGCWRNLETSRVLVYSSFGGSTLGDTKGLLLLPLCLGITPGRLEDDIGCWELNQG